MAEDNYINAAIYTYGGRLTYIQRSFSAIVGLSEDWTYGDSNVGYFRITFFMPESGKVSGSLYYVGAEGTYVFYGGVRYEGEAGMYRLMGVLEKEKIQNLLETM